jgi:hypothetical protein
MALQYVIVYVVRNNRAPEATDITGRSSGAMVSPPIPGLSSGILDVKFSLPRSARSASLVQFVVVDPLGNTGSVTVPMNGSGGGDDDSDDD